MRLRGDQTTFIEGLMGTGKVPTLDVWGRGGKLRSQFRLGWNCNNFSRFLFYLTSNKAVRSWGQEGAEGSQNSGGQLYSFIQWEGGEQQNKARKASFPVPSPSWLFEAGAEVWRGDERGDE